MYKKSQKKRDRIKRLEEFEYKILPYILSIPIIFLAFCGFIYVNLHVHIITGRSDIVLVVVIGLIAWAFLTVFIQNHIKWILKWSFLFFDFFIFLFRRWKNRKKKGKQLQ